jgi:uncharacterized MAPEG superfamily protein
MQDLIENPAFRVYALCSAVLALQLILLAIWTATVRGKVKKFINPEDSTTFKGQNVGVDDDAVLRVKRAHQNAIENAVPFFAVGLLYVLTGATKLGAEAYFFTFTGARVLHSLFYLAGKQPWRTLMWVIGVLATVGMAVHVLRVAL